MTKDEDQTLQEQFVTFFTDEQLIREDRADAYRARRDTETFTESEERKRKQRVASRAFQARKSPEDRALAAAKFADYQWERRANETPAERDIRRAKQREYNRAWRARKKVEKQCNSHQNIRKLQRSAKSA